MVNSKGMSNDSPIPKSNKSDSGSSEDFDFYGFTKPLFTTMQYQYLCPQAWLFLLTVLIYITTPCSLRTGLWLVEW